MSLRGRKRKQGPRERLCHPWQRAFFACTWLMNCAAFVAHPEWYSGVIGRLLVATAFVMLAIGEITDKNCTHRGIQDGTTAQSQCDP